MICILILVEFHNEVKVSITLLVCLIFFKHPVKTWGHAYPGGLSCILHGNLENYGQLQIQSYSKTNKKNTLICKFGGWE